MLLISVGAHIFQHLLQQTETILCFCFVLLILFFVCLFVFQQLHISPVLEKLGHTEIQIIQLWRESCYGYLMMVSEGKRLLWLHCPGVCPSSTLLSVSVTSNRREMSQKAAFLQHIPTKDTALEAICFASWQARGPHSPGNGNTQLELAHSQTWLRGTTSCFWPSRRAKQKQETEVALKWGTYKAERNRTNSMGLEGSWGCAGSRGRAAPCRHTELLKGSPRNVNQRCKLCKGCDNSLSNSIKFFGVTQIKCFSKLDCRLDNKSQMIFLHVCKTFPCTGSKYFVHIPLCIIGTPDKAVKKSINRDA